MTEPTWAEASTPSTLAEVRDALMSSLESAGSDINGWSDGAPQRALVEGEARAISFETDTRAAIAKTASPTTVTAAGTDWVDAIMSWFDLDNGAGGKGRYLATKAKWAIPLQVTVGGAPFVVTNTSRIQVQALNGAIFESTQDTPVTLNSASSYKGVVNFTARLAGITGNATPGQITRIISGPSGISAVSVDLTETQIRTVTARDPETDAAFIARGLGRWGTQGAGWTRPALDYLIPLYGNTATTSVTRWSVDDANPNGPGTVQVWLADASGPATAETVTAVSDGLNGIDVKPVGSGDLTVSPSTAVALTLDIVLVVDGSNPDVAANAIAALGALEAVFPLGPSVLEPDLVSAIVRGSPVNTATVLLTGATTQLLSLALAGFGSVIEVADVDMTGPVTLAPGEVLDLTVNVTTESP